MIPNQSVATATMLANSADWDTLTPHLQKIIEAVNKGLVGPWLTNALIKQEWNNGRFIVRDHFKVDISKNAKVKISYLGDNLKAWFLGGTEELDKVHELTGFLLTEGTFDKDIIDKIGGVEKCVSSLQDVLAKMKAQPKGPESGNGPLLTNGYANIIYIPQAVTKLSDNSFSYVNGVTGQVVVEEIKDPRYLFEVNGQWFVLRAVGVHWRGDGWYVLADSVEDPSRWIVGFQLFSRKVLESSETLAQAQV